MVTRALATDQREMGLRSAARVADVWSGKTVTSAAPEALGGRLGHGRFAARAPPRRIEGAILATDCATLAGTCD